MGVYDAGEKLALLGIRGEDPNHWDAMGWGLEDFYLLVVMGRGEVPFLVEVEKIPSLAVSDEIG